MKWNLLFFTLTLALAAALVSTTPAGAVQIAFTGDVVADFPAFALYPDHGGTGDVGGPASAPPGTSFGWDLENVGIAFDATTDTLFVGFNMANGAISGDADGDGSPGQTAAWLASLLGTDLADLAGGEAIDILIDVDQSCEFGFAQASDYEVVAGILNTDDITSFSVNPFSQDPLDWTTPGAGHVSPTSFSGTVFASPSASQPDLEFQINNFCATILPMCTPGVTPINFAFRARAGSAADDGIGEDAIACTDITLTPTAVTMVGIQARTESRPTWAGLVMLLIVLTGALGMRMAKLGRGADR